jgi:hypothetical protein
VGINPECGILKAGVGGSLGNIANMIACGLSMIVVGALIIITTRRRAAVGAFHSNPSRLGSSKVLNVSRLLQVVRSFAFCSYCISFLCRSNSSRPALFYNKDH